MTDTTPAPRKPGRPKKPADAELATVASGETVVAAADAVGEGAKNLKVILNLETVPGEPAPVGDAVRLLVAALGAEETFVRAIDIRGNGIVRLYGNDNSVRSVRFEGLNR